MKYPVASNEVDKEKGIAYKKFGYFQSEKEIVKTIWKETGLRKGCRHPLTYIMEACDDIAYSVLDAEDAVKKSIISFSDLMTFLEHHHGGDKLVKCVIKKAKKKHADYLNVDLSPSELNDISMQMFRVYAIHEMIVAVTNAYLDPKHKAKLIVGSFDKELIEVSKAAKIRELLKEFDKSHVYQHRAILEVELTGYNTINQLMDIFWGAIQTKYKHKDRKPEFSAPYADYVFSRISENYRRVFLDKENKLPKRYKELQLITDMVSGMTDSYAISLLQNLKQYAEN